MKPAWRWIIAFAVMGLGILPGHARAATEVFETGALPELPHTARHAVVGAQGETLLALIPTDAETPEGSTDVYRLDEGNDAWELVGQVDGFDSPGTAVSTPNGVVLIGGMLDGRPVDDVTRLRWDADSQQFKTTSLPQAPVSLDRAAASAIGSTLYLTDGQAVWSLAEGDEAWQPLPAQAIPAVERPTLINLQGKLYLIGAASIGNVAFRFDPKSETWAPLTGPEQWPGRPAGVAFGLSHILIFAQPRDATPGEAFAYHAITDKWISFGSLAHPLGETPAAARLADHAIVLGEHDVMLIRPVQLKTNYGWIDNTVVAGYLLGMVGIGWYFTKRENSSNDFFRGGQRIPWWAAGMSLFATGASAISLAGMPGMGFGTDWTYFVISICSAICLPIGIFIMAPLVRRLQISTANEYLERRFGLTSRLFASVIFMFTQVAARIASVMLLSAIALEAITDMDIMTAIIIMGVVTTIYTYLGGLEAVIWTDTVQGFVMVATVVGCLLLAIFKLDMPFGEMWSQAQSYEKFHMFDFSNSLIGPTTYIFFVHTLFLTFGGISDQNFVQRVQSTPDLRQTKMAVATQMAVAVPINVLLFSLGTALWLFYRTHPDLLSPTIVNNDGVFPFFAAQQLPVGVSGIVVAALLAATMSTVSSSICAVSDLGTNDFYKRFKHDATDHQCLILGRILTAVVGISGTLAAIMLASIENVKSVWDLAIMVTGLISSSVIGLFMLGLVTRKTHEAGALVGAAAGMTTIILMRMYCPITFWLYIVIGPIVTIVVGSTASLLLPGKPRRTEGLTIYSLNRASAKEHTPPGPAGEAAGKPTPA